MKLNIYQGFKTTKEGNPYYTDEYRAENKLDAARYLRCLPEEIKVVKTGVPATIDEVIARSYIDSHPALTPNHVKSIRKNWPAKTVVRPKKKAKKTSYNPGHGGIG